MEGIFLILAIYVKLLGDSNSPNYPVEDNYFMEKYLVQL